MVPQRVISSSPMENWTLLCRCWFWEQSSTLHGHINVSSPILGINCRVRQKFACLFFPGLQSFILSSQPVNKQYCCSPEETCAFEVVNTAVAWRVHCNRGRKTILPWCPASACFLTLLAASGSCSQTRLLSADSRLRAVCYSPCPSPSP